MGGTTNTDRIERNTDAIRRAEQTLATHGERFGSVNGKLDSLSRDFEQHRAELRQELKELIDSVANQHGTLGRHDERVKQIEQRLERRWNLLLIIVGAFAGVVLTVIGDIITTWLAAKN